ncbi:Alpha/beta knot methyltransferase [Achaetomium macrosporum]|uniref:rRNA methyltransferase 1, mitochondrial n=1 Tax=Achaetomium macrosporum TaxID=79813 RepID=A0AAN7CGY5_9PEZI|nr:Alpha/beta knot methyltransferase [Achaetomium macrosporum]
MTLALVFRAARPSPVAAPALSVTLTAPSIRHASLVSSLAAIHKGLARSERARPQGARTDKISDQGTTRMTYAERQKAREELAKQRPTFKIRKGKKDITEYPDKVKKKSRQARLVYQLKAGKLGAQLKELLSQDGGKASEPSAFERTGPRPDLKDRPRQVAASASRDRSLSNDRDVVAELSRTTGDSGRSSRSKGQPSTGRARKGRARRVSSLDAHIARHRPRETPPVGPRVAKPAKVREPLSIPYTTAASQFLYGKAVVQAALKSSRRKLYKLYIYGGANRQNPHEDNLMQNLAKRKGVPVTILGEDGLRLMDKMAQSRPHNGYVLEASPLPQPPLKTLGPLPEDYASNPRCLFELAHQSTEEALINGYPESIPSPSATHKPLVVVLDQILDPQNLGAILRTVSFLGATAVGITRHGSAPLGNVAVKASAGASETFNLFAIDSLPQFLNNSRANGWAVYAAVANGPTGTKQRRHVSLIDVEETDPLRREPCVLLVGNEGKGLDRLVVKKADYEVNIPNLSPSDTVDSLNVSVATGLLCSAFLRGMVRERERAETEGKGLALF